MEFGTQTGDQKTWGAEFSDRAKGQSEMGSWPSSKGQNDSRAGPDRGKDRNDETTWFGEVRSANQFQSADVCATGWLVAQFTSLCEGFGDCENAEKQKNQKLENQATAMAARPPCG